MTRHVTHWIGGKPYGGESARRGEIFEPASGRVAGTVDLAGDTEVDAAVAAAKAAFPGWRDASLSQRTKVLFRFRELVDAHRGELARLISSEHGKVVADAAGEVARGLEVAEFACGIPHLLKGGFSENVSSRVDAYSILQPVGVAAGITPFNFPAMVPMWMFPVAIACGNTFVLKPSEKDPSASVRLAELWAEAGLPDGVFNVLHGDRAAVDGLLRHPDVRAVSFVGSTPVARHIYGTAAANGKRVQALGGAKNHMLVLPDADLDLAADAAVSAGFGSAGERCMAISVVVAVDPVGDELTAKIKERVAGLRVGPGDHPEAQMGPLVTRAHRDRVASYLDGAVAQGATLAVDGRDPDVLGGAGDGFARGRRPAARRGRSSCPPADSWSRGLPPPKSSRDGINVADRALRSRRAEDHSPGSGRGDSAADGSPGNASGGAAEPDLDRQRAAHAEARCALSAANARRSGEEAPARPT
ncbi:CoA-acylating methylmalonate-semialdehyde dehydrogenase [Actinomadura sp. NPDC048032]|uniref:CoA-acylating methylmalonate-semialdehyde dehydrogenase n=1 Tax=Actinomadura sp. NPDC048032 TaxID=3155747 RepID=UPI0033F8CC87